jgi:hypothetical protein
MGAGLRRAIHAVSVNQIDCEDVRRSQCSGFLIYGTSAIGEFPIWFYPQKDFPMLREIDWESQIGRRPRLWDLHVFSTVVQRGSMAKAAQHLGVSQPAVSEVIADLEHALGVRLLDRSAQGIEPTIYGGSCPTGRP